jgi:transcriptional regulator with XRE-family HTH domain
MALVTEVTRNANSDDLTATDYREIYEELRSSHTLRQFAELVHTRYSIAWWSKFERGEVELTREARNELRRAVGPDELPPTVTEAIAEVDPNAAVYRVGAQRPNRVVLVGHDEPITMHLNGTLTIVDVVPQRHVTAVTRRARRVSVSIQPALHERLNALRTARNWSWEELLEAVVETLEA